MVDAQGALRKLNVLIRPAALQKFPFDQTSVPAWPVSRRDFLVQTAAPPDQSALVRRSKSGNRAKFTEMRRTSSRVSSWPSGQQHGGGLKRTGHKRNRAEVEHSTYGDGNKDGETKLEQSFA